MKHPKIFDKLLELVAAATTTAVSAYGTALSAPWLTPYNPWNDSHKHSVDVVFDVTALTLNGATVTLVVQVDDDSGFASNQKTVASMAITTTGRFILPIDLSTIPTILAASDYIRAGVTLSGGGGSETITYGAFIAKS